MTPALEKLIAHFASLPSIGKKSAVRLAYHVLEMNDNDVASFASALLEVKKSIGLCSVCQCYSETEVCRFCEDPAREKNVIMCVEDNRALEAIEALHEYRGRYHVLHGVISPIDGIGPDKLKIKELLARLDGDVREVIIATNPSVSYEYHDDGLVVMIGGLFPFNTIKFCGDYFADPKWGKGFRRGSIVEAELDLLFTAEQIGTLTVDEIKSGETWTKTGNFLLISGDTKTCYHIVKNADGTLKQHLHIDAGEETVNGEVNVWIVLMFIITILI